MVNYKQDRQDLGYLPSDGELLKAYLERLRSVIQQNRYAYAPQHEKWFTHYSASPCWICNFMDLTDYLLGVISDMEKELKNYTWKCVKPVGQMDPTTFQFKPIKQSK